MTVHDTNSPTVAAHPRHGSDMKAAFTGLFVGAILLAVILYGVVQWTNSRFEGHAPAAAEAGH